MNLATNNFKNNFKDSHCEADGEGSEASYAEIMHNIEGIVCQLSTCLSRDVQFKHKLVDRRHQANFLTAHLSYLAVIY